MDLDSRDQELRDEAHRGRVGQGAIVESMARLRDSIDKLEAATTKQGKVMLGMTVFIIALTLVLVVKEFL